MEDILTHPWIEHTLSPPTKKSLDRSLSTRHHQISTEIKNGVHESAKLTLGDWDGGQNT